MTLFPRSWPEGLWAFVLLGPATISAAGACQDSDVASEVPVDGAPADTAAAALDPEVRTEPLDSVRVLKVWLVNRRSSPVIVEATAGADPVAVDSLEPLDSARVNLEVRADSVRLTTRSADGRELGARWLRVAEDSVTRLELP